MPPKTQAKSLDDFAAATPAATKRGRWIEDLPEWADIATAYRKGIGPRVIYEWLLQEKGYDSSQLRGYDRFRIALRYAVQS